MKKFILLTALAISTLISCSTEEDAPVYNQNSSKTSSIKETSSDFCITCRDSTGRGNDTIVVESEPVKPIKD